MVRSLRLKTRSLPLMGLLLLVTACGGSSEADKPAHAGKRIAVLEAARKPVADSGLSSYEFELPEPALIPDWAQNGGNTEHSVGNPSLASAPEKLWSTSIGSGSNSNYKLLSNPVLSEKVIYAMDSRGRVSAMSATDGSRLWRVETAPENSDGDAMGGGIAVRGGVLYATTGFGEVIALRTSDGVVKWRQMLGKPLRSAPTVYEGRVFAITIENETFALDAKTGNIMWRHNGIAENATLMGASSPAVHGDTVVVAYSSGEVFGLRSQNGRVVWGEVLAVPTQIGALPAIADIRGLPVIDRARVYTTSHSGRTVSIDERTGDRAWEADLGGINTPAVVGNAVYMVTLDNELLALSRESGRIIWTVDLQKFKDPDDRESKRVMWFGPVMAGNHLWLTNSLGQLASFAPRTGYQLSNEEITGDSIFLPPITAGGVLYVLTDDGQLIAMK